MADRKRVFGALVHFAQLTPDQARRVLGSDTSLRVAVTDRGPGRHGFYPGVGNTIQLPQTIVRQYNRLMTLAPVAGRRSHEWHELVVQANAILEAMILHQVVNWGAHRGGTKTRNASLTQAQHEPGDEFELQAYGTVVSTQPIEGWIGWEFARQGDHSTVTAYDEDPDYPPAVPSVDPMDPPADSAADGVS